MLTREEFTAGQMEQMSITVAGSMVSPMREHFMEAVLVLFWQDMNCTVELPYACSK